MIASKHKYDYPVDADSGSAAARVVRLTGNDKRVLELGAGPGSITRLLKERNGCRVTAIENDPTALEHLAPSCERVVQGDLNDSGWTSLVSGEEKFDAVVAADVLEHLVDPWSALSAIKDVLDDSGHAIVSLPHAGHNAVIACLADEDFEYRPWGLLDKTHLRFFGLKNIERLFVEAGFKIVEAEFVLLHPESTELAPAWKRIPRALRAELRKNRFGGVYQVVVKARPDPAPETGLSLLSIPAAMPKPEVRDGHRGVDRVLRRLGLRS